jgi:hypothetical protein
LALLLDDDDARASRVDSSPTVNIEDQEFLCGPRIFVIGINAARRRLRSLLAAAPTKLHHAGMDGKAPAQPSDGRFSASRPQNDRFGRRAQSCGAISINSAPSNSRLQPSPKYLTAFSTISARSGRPESTDIVL